MYRFLFSSIPLSTLRISSSSRLVSVHDFTHFPALLKLNPDVQDWLHLFELTRDCGKAVNPDLQVASSPYTNLLTVSVTFFLHVLLEKFVTQSNTLLIQPPRICYTINYFFYCLCYCLPFTTCCTISSISRSTFYEVCIRLV